MAEPYKEIADELQNLKQRYMTTTVKDAGIIMPYDTEISENFDGLIEDVLVSHTAYTDK